MGGCCCSSRRAESNRTPLYIYCPREIEEREPLSSTQVPSGALANLETSVPDTYRAPPAPLPYTQPSDGRSEHSVICVGLEKTESKIKADSGFEPIESPPKLTEDDKPSKLNEPIDEDDGCPICLEEYDVENPRIITKCEHHFHLSCILEWMERSGSCPICDQIMMIDHTSHG